MGHLHPVDHTKDTDITPPVHHRKDEWKDKKAKKERNHEEGVHQAPAPILVANEAALQPRTRRYFFVLDRRFNSGKLSVLMWIPKTDDGECRFLFPRHDCPEALETLPLSESVRFVSRLNNISMGAQLVVDESSDAAGRVKTYFVENYSGSPTVHPIEAERKEYILKSIVLLPEIIPRLNPRGERVLTKVVEFVYKLPAYKAEIKPLATALGISKAQKSAGSQRSFGDQGLLKGGPTTLPCRREITNPAPGQRVRCPGASSFIVIIIKLCILFELWLTTCATPVTRRAYDEATTLL